MNKEEAVKLLNEYEFKISAFNLLLSTVNYDNDTIAPSDGDTYRNERMVYIDTLAYDLKTSDEFTSLIEEMDKMDLDEVNRRKADLYLKEIRRLKAIPKDFYEEYNLNLLESCNAWKKAKEADDYSIFEPYLIKTIELEKKKARYIDESRNVYDVLLDDYEEGFDEKTYDIFFDLIKKEIIPLIKEVSCRNIIDDDMLHQYYDPAKQEILADVLKKYLRFTDNWGYMGTSPHPFTSGLSNNDVRITTNYDTHNLTASIYSIIHEIGHAYYEHQVDDIYDGTIIKSTISSGMHESQSRLLENIIGRDKSFIKGYFNDMKNIFPDELKGLEAGDYWLMTNISRPSLIRCDADELTYPIHILIRYEMEKDIFNDRIDLNHLKDIWNDKYEEYLGIRPEHDKDGILQDIHWSEGLFGYFPTYALGSAVASQIAVRMNRDIDIGKCLDEGNIKAITDYLGKHVHRFANLYPLNTIIHNLTGEDFKPDYYISYLKNKYKALYRID